MSAAPDIVSAIEHGIKTKTPARLIALNIASILRSHADGEYPPLFPEDDSDQARGAYQALMTLADDIDAALRPSPKSPAE